MESKDRVTGERFGRLVVIKRANARKDRHIYYECLCDCGNAVVVRGVYLKSGKTRSCGCLRNSATGPRKPQEKRKMSDKPHKRIGRTYNRLTIIDIIQEIHKPTLAVCRCSCGNIVTKQYKNVVKGRVKSCGCIIREIKETARIRKIQAQEKSKERQLPAPKRDFTGMQFGYLTVLYWCGIKIMKGGALKHLWLCQCRCGNLTVKTAEAFKIKDISCGCTLFNARSNRAKVLNTNKKQQMLTYLSNEWTPRDDEDHKNRRFKALLRNQTFLKHGEECIICHTPNTKEHPLHCHHLKPHWLYPQLRYMVANLIPLCEHCHTELHKALGTFNPSIEDQMDFIKNRQMALKLTA